MIFEIEGVIVGYVVIKEPNKLAKKETFEIVNKVFRFEGKDKRISIYKRRIKNKNKIIKKWKTR